MQSASKIAPSSIGLQAIRAALAGAEVARAKQAAGLNPRRKSEDLADLVTEGDEAAQAAILEALPRYYGGDVVTVLAEEKTVPEPLPINSHWRWVIDPIDGTLPYSKGEPFWCVSIALQELHDEWESRIGVILHARNPDAVLYAERGKGAFSYAPATGSFLPLARPDRISPVAEFSADGTFKELAEREFAKRGIATRFRRSLCNSACELLAGEECAVVQDAGPLEWDVAAITLIAREAGAHVHAQRVDQVAGVDRYDVIMSWDENLFETLRESLP